MIRANTGAKQQQNALLQEYAPLRRSAQSRSREAHSDGMQGSLEPGLYVACTPLGNLGDASPRLKQVLQAADVIAHEKARGGAMNLLHALGISKSAQFSSIVKLNTFEEQHRSHELARRALSTSVAIVSDAGSPCVSDPGTDVVRAAHALGASVVPVPGPSAFTAALSVSGFNVNATGVSLLGFLPRRSAERRRKLQLAASLLHAAVLFEAPQRVVNVLDDAQAVGFASVCVCREISKVHEEIFRGSLHEVISLLRQRSSENKLKGEMTVVLDAPTTADAGPSADVTDEEIEELMMSLLLDEKKSVNTASKEATELLGIKRKRAYNAGLRVQRRQDGDSAE